ncbi:MAG: RuBisCO large subunit C-terminal-like domain-containing protein [archaeon]
MSTGRSIFFARPEDIDSDDYVIAQYYVESKQLTTSKAGEQIATEESIGTWTQITTTTERVQRTLAAKVFKWKGKNRGQVTVAFPNELFDAESGGVANILSIVAGNLFGLSSIDNVRLLDVEFSKTIVKQFPGPKFGIEGVRRIAGTLDDRRPHLGTIIKPKVGLTPKETAEVAYRAAVGGVDLIKDDETLTNQVFCPLEERLTQVLEALDKAKSETGRHVFYALNITGNINFMFETVERALSQGANMIMIDVLTAGFPVVSKLASDPSVKVPLHIHRAMHAAMTRNPRHGIHPIVLARLFRISGADQAHTGSAAGKMESQAEEQKRIVQAVREEFYGLRQTFPVASGGVHPALVARNLDVLGQDLVINAGGGIHGHPLGTEKGAMAMRQAIDAWTQGIPAKEYAKTHEELRIALNHWPAKSLKED